MMTPTQFKEVRLSLGLTQLELAAKLGVAENTVTRWEAGMRKRIPQPIERLMRIYMATGVA
jgi:transcriptional regulator with XRE-family HTH domain